MIPMSAAGKGRTNRFQAIMVSDDTNSAAPIPASTFPVARAVASITEITTMYSATGTASRTLPPERAQDAASQGRHDHDHHGRRDREGDATGAVSPEARDVAEVADEEGGQPRHEPVGAGA